MKTNVEKKKKKKLRMVWSTELAFAEATRINSLERRGPSLG